MLFQSMFLLGPVSYANFIFPLDILFHTVIFGCYFHSVIFHFCFHTGSSASTSSDNEIQALQPWVCLLATKVYNKDAMIAREALELLVACLQLRHQNLGKYSVILSKKAVSANIKHR